MPTPLNIYFPFNISERIEELLRIKCMEHFISLSEDPDVLNDIAIILEIDKEKLKDVITSAKKELFIPKRSNRKYPLGGLKK